eukprot:gene7195-8001_t
MKLFTSEEIEQIRQHKYKSQGMSMLEAVVDPYWEKAVSKLPKWLSPNALTIVGLASVILPCFVLLVNCQQGNFENIPCASLFCSAGFLIWMNMDCMDGKLAKKNRPKKQSPFGELLDHGGDALTLVFSSIALSCQIGLDKRPGLLLLFVFINICTNYMTEPLTIYITGILQFQSLDFVEAALSMSVISLVTGTSGLQIWNYVISGYLNLQLWHLVFGIQLLIATDIVFGRCPNLYSTAKQRGFDFLDFIYPVMQEALFILCGFISYYFSTTEFLNQYVILVSLFFGIIQCKLHIMLIALNMLAVKFRSFNYTIVFPVVFAFGMFVLQSEKAERCFLFVALAVACIDTGIYLFRLYYQIYKVFGERILVLNTANQNDTK